MKPRPRLCTVLAFLAACLTAQADDSRPTAGGDNGRFPWLPPEWAARVVYYQTFENADGKAEINAINAQIKVAAAPRRVNNGMSGFAYAAKEPTKTAVAVSSPALSVDKPLTVMTWFRVATPMTETTGFGILWINSRNSYIANFVRGKGEWCGLKRPTCVSQIQNFPGIRNINHPWGGSAWFRPGEWHHAAITVSGARQVRIYWDGKPRQSFNIQGRSFREGDTDTLRIGNPEWGGHPIALDEIVIVNRALDEEEIADYVFTARKLREVNFPVERHR